MTQLMLPAWPAPRFPDSWRYCRNAFACPINVHGPFCEWSMYIADASGSQLVPDPSRAIARMSWTAGAPESGGCSDCARTAARCPVMNTIAAPMRRGLRRLINMSLSPDESYVGTEGGPAKRQLPPRADPPERGLDAKRCVE